MREKLIKKNLDYIINTLNITDEFRKDRIRYGLETLINEAIKLTIIFSIAAILNLKGQYFIFVILMMSIRTSIGGSHAKTFAGCLTCSTILFLSLSFISKYLNNINPIIEILVILLIVSVLFTVKYKTKLYKLGKNRKKTIKLRVKLILLAITMLVIIKFMFNEYYSFVILTELYIILDYLNEWRKLKC